MISNDMKLLAYGNAVVASNRVPQYIIDKVSSLTNTNDVIKYWKHTMTRSAQIVINNTKMKYIKIFTRLIKHTNDYIEKHMYDQHTQVIDMLGFCMYANGYHDLGIKIYKLGAKRNSPSSLFELGYHYQITKQENYMHKYYSKCMKINKFFSKESACNIACILTNKFLNNEQGNPKKINRLFLYALRNRDKIALCAYGKFLVFTNRETDGFVKLLLASLYGSEEAKNFFSGYMLKVYNINVHNRIWKIYSPYDKNIHFMKLTECSQ